MWSSERISNILQNEIYIGNMVQGKSKKISYKSGKCLHVDRKDWIVVANTHEPLVERDVFDKVQLLVASRKKTRERTYDSLLKGVICCHECGYPLAVVNRPNAKGEDTLYFICRTYQRFTRARKCTCHSVKVETVTDAVLEKVDDICKRYVNEQELVDVAGQVLEKNGKQADGAAEIARIENRIAALSTNLDSIYMDKLSGMLAEADFARVYTKVKEERSALEEKKKRVEVESRRTPEENIKRAKALVRRFLNSTHCNRELLVSLEKVELTEEKELLIHFRFRQMEAENHLQ
jgi:hypothetical protein